MEITIYYLINFVLYSIGNALMVSVFSFMLTPKTSRAFTLLVSNGLVFVLGAVKYFVFIPGEFVESMLQLANVAGMLLLTIVLYKEKIWVSIAVFLMSVVVMFVSSVAWIIVPLEGEYDYNITGVEAYVCGLTIMVIGYSLIIYYKNKIVVGGRRFNSVMLLELGLVFYYVLFVGQRESFKIIFGGRFALVIMFLLYSIMVVTPMMLIVFHSVRMTDYERKKELLELSIAIRENEQKYQKTAESVEHLAKIRHDFYDNLSVVRQILKENPKEGERLLGEMRRRNAGS